MSKCILLIAPFMYSYCK